MTGRILSSLHRLLPALWLAVVSLDAAAADVIRGGEIYRANCANCHGPNGRPVFPTAPDFTRQERLLQSDPVLLQSVRNGRGPMPAFQGLLRDREILDVIAYLRTLR
ncbi:MAG: cytochrome c [Burkholderiaceae bacterium]|nr:cytochrome c [Burkholderiaceae bacterium]